MHNEVRVPASRGITPRPTGVNPEVSNSVRADIPAAAMAAPVGSVTVRGAFWTIGAALLNKLVAFGCQLALAWYLLPQDFGLVGMALSVTSLAALVSGMNLKNVLIQRQAHFERDAGQVFWLSLVMGMAGSVVLVIAAPLAGYVLGDPRVGPLILLVSISNLLGSAPAVYAAVLSRDLRFRPVAAMHLVSGFINNLGAVLLAAMGFGPYSLILPLLASSAFALIAHRICAGKVAIPRPDPAVWKALLRPAGLLMLHSFLGALLGYGTNFIIGVQHDATTAGYYFWGFSIAAQAVYLLASNLQGVLFPALTKLNLEPVRQLEAFRKACSVLLLATTPICVLQILLAEPAIRLLFHERWLPAVGVVQGLSIGLMTQAVNIAATSLLMAHGAFGTLCRLTGSSAVLTLAAAALAGAFGKQTAIAFAAGGVMLVMNLVAGWRAIHFLNMGWLQLLEIVRFPAVLGGTCLVAGFLILMPLEGLHGLLQCAVVGILITGFSLAWAAKVRPEFRALFRHKMMVEIEPSTNGVERTRHSAG